jgi:hypothetical protein
MSNSGGNYHSQRRHYLAATSDSLRGQQQQLAANPPLTTTAGANGLPPPSSSSSNSTRTLVEQRSLARRHQAQQNSNNNNHQPPAKSCPQSLPACQQQSRHFFGPIEPMTMHRAGEANSIHHRLDHHQPIVFAADSPATASRQQQHSASMGQQHASKLTDGGGGEHHNSNTSTARDRIERHLYPDGLQHQQLRQGVIDASRHHNNHQNHHQHQHQQHQQQHNHHARQMPCTSQARGFAGMTECDRGAHDDYQDDRLEPAPARLEHDQQDQYAHQMRRSQMQHRMGLPPHQQVAPGFHASPKAATSSAVAPTLRQVQASHRQRQPATSGSSGDSKQQQPARESLHVNFNRSSQRGAVEGDDDESGESTRKKKYLTAKYGQQQMNLIKKRLKIEMWLHDQLQELAKLSKSIEVSSQSSESDPRFALCVATT